MKQQVIISGKEALMIVGNYVLDNTNMTKASAKVKPDSKDPCGFCVVVEGIEE